MTNVDVYFANPERCSGPRLARAFALLDSAEQERAASLPALARRDFVVAHALRHLALRQRSGGVSSSYASRLVGCAVGGGGRLGFDLELAEIAWPRAVLRFLAPEEQAWLRQADQRGRWRRFYTLWVLKEAFLKALGVGLDGGLSSFWVQPLAGGSAMLRRYDAAPDALPRWQLRHWRRGKYHAALALESTSDLPLHYSLRGSWQLIA